MATIRELERWRHDNPLSSWEQLNRNLADLERILKVKDSLTEGISQIEVSGAAPAVGDVLRWNGSQFVPWSPKYLTARLSADQTANLAAGNHVQFNTVSADSGHITLSTGAGQANGIFTIPAGVWKIDIHVGADSSAPNAFAVFRLVDDPGNLAIAGTQSATLVSVTRAVDQAADPSASYILDTAATVDVKVNIINPSNLAAISGSTETHIAIFALA